VTMQSVQFEAPRGLGKFALFARDIKISHTVFAMPWALLSMVMAGHGMRDGITLIKIALILICMVAARTVAMASNRLLDARLDAANPRTARRAIPAGILSRRFYLAILASCAAAFGAACGGFWVIYRNPWPIALAEAPLAIKGYGPVKDKSIAAAQIRQAALLRAFRQPESALGNVA